MHSHPAQPNPRPGPTPYLQLHAAPRPAACPSMPIHRHWPLLEALLNIAPYQYPALTVDCLAEKVPQWLPAASCVLPSPLSQSTPMRRETHHHHFTRLQHAPGLSCQHVWLRRHLLASSQHTESSGSHMADLYRLYGSFCCRQCHHAAILARRLPAIAHSQPLHGTGPFALCKHPSLAQSCSCTH